MTDFLAKYLKDWRVWTLTGAIFGFTVAATFVGRVAALFLVGMAAASAVAIAVVRLLGRRLRARNAHELERGMMAMPSPPLADGRASIQELNRGFRESLDRLRDAPELGSDYLYRVPWYLMIGEPASGKTTTVRHSKLDLIGDKQQGIGGTLNCDWFFTNHGIILDTAGRYVYAEEGAPDKKEWENFLGLLKRHRPRQPLNGVILVIPVVRTRDSLDVPLLLPGAEGDEELLARCTRDAEKLYAKVSQLPQKLGIRFPVYILLTKCDKVPGFQEFFTQAPMEYQTQLLGWSNPEVEAPYASNMVDRAFETVDRNLERARLEILARELPLAFPDEVFIFPEEFKRLREPLRRYTDVLFKRNIFQESLLFRGIYFSSGLQDRKPLQGLLGGAPISGDEAGALREAAAAQKSGIFGAPPSALFESKPYFIRDFYTERVFPESGLVRPTRARYQKAKQLTTVLRAATLAIGIGGLTAFALYVAMVLSSSSELTDAVKPLATDTSRGLEVVKLKKLDQADRYTSAVTRALFDAHKFDYWFLRWLKIDLPTQEVRDSSQTVFWNLVLRPLAARFWDGFKLEVTRNLARPDLVRPEKPIKKIAEAELLKLLESWKNQVTTYEQVVAGSNLPASERLARLWKLATGQDQLSSQLQGFLQGRGAQEGLAEHLDRLPALESGLASLRSGIEKKIDELDEAVKLPVEFDIEILGEKARPVEVLADEKASFADRRDALRKVVAEVDGLSKELFEDRASARLVEEIFADQFNKRAEEIKDLRAGAQPLCNPPPRAGLLERAKDFVADKGEKKAPAAPEGPWRTSERWKRLQTLLGSDKVRTRGLDPAAREPVFIFHTAEFPVEGGLPERKVVNTLSDKARDFLRQVQFIRDQKGLLDDPVTAIPDAEKLDQEVDDALAKLVNEGFIADKRQLGLIARVREILAGEAKFKAGDGLTGTGPAGRGPTGGARPTTGPLPPESPSLVRIVQELVQRQVWAAIYQALAKEPPPAQEEAVLALGADAEAAFLHPLTKSDWIGAEQRDVVERIQIQHAQNRLAAARRSLDSSNVFDLEALQAGLAIWVFGPESDTVNLTKLFKTGQTSHSAYFDTSVNQVHAQYADLIDKSKCLELLKAHEPQVQGANYTFWVGTRDEVKRGTKEPEAVKRKTRFTGLIERVTRLQAKGTVLYGPLTRFLDEEAGIRDQVKPDASFLDARYIQVRNLVSARIGQYLAVEFRKEFSEFAQEAYRELYGKFPVYLSLTAAEKPYGRLSESVVQKKEAFLQKWGLQVAEKPAAAGESKKPLHEYIEDLFVEGSGVGLVRAYLDLMAFVGGNFFPDLYKIQVKVISNLDEQFQSTLSDRERAEFRAANQVLSRQGFRIKIGDSAELPMNPGQETEATWVNLSGIRFSVRVPVDEKKFSLNHPDEKSPAAPTASYEFASGQNAQWGLFRMLVQQKFRLDPNANILRFQFKIQPALSVSGGGEIQQVPVYVAFKFARASGSEVAAPAYRPFDGGKLERLYGAFAMPTLKLVIEP